MYESNVANYVKHSGKIRDVYEFGETMLIIVTSDRVSAFNRTIPNLEIPDKGKILQSLSLYWSEVLEFKYHLISVDPSQLPNDFRGPEFENRTMLVEKAVVIPFECVVRGYLTGSAWKNYQETGEVFGIKLPAGLKENQQFPKPLFTPTRKSDNDLNVSFEIMASELGLELTAEIEALSIELYQDASQIAWSNGIIIADTKFEWGIVPHMENELVVIDEVLTPDSSRFWNLADYKLGYYINSFDKQYLRDWLNHHGEPVPEDVARYTREKYVQAYEGITGQKWK